MARTDGRRPRRDALRVTARLGLGIRHPRKEVLREDDLMKLGTVRRGETGGLRDAQRRIPNPSGYCRVETLATEPGESPDGRRRPWVAEGSAGTSTGAAVVPVPTPRSTGPRVGRLPHDPAGSDTSPASRPGRRVVGLRIWPGSRAPHAGGGDAAPTGVPDRPERHPLAGTAGVPRTNPSDPDFESEVVDLARQRGDELMRVGRPDRAAAAYTEGLDLVPHAAALLHGRGLAHHARGDLPLALADLDAAVTRCPHDSSLLNNRGLVRLSAGRTADALADFAGSVDLDPRHAAVHYNLGRTLALLGRMPRAVAAYDAALRLDAGCAKVWKARGDARARLGDFSGALTDFEEALRLRPDDGAAYNNRGLLRLALGDLRGAADDFEAAADLLPDVAVVQFNRGRAYSGLGRDAEAIFSFDAALRLDPSSGRTYRARGEALARLGDPARAAADLAAADRLDGTAGADGPAAQVTVA